MLTFVSLPSLAHMSNVFLRCGRVQRPVVAILARAFQESASPFLFRPLRGVAPSCRQASYGDRELLELEKFNTTENTSVYLFGVLRRELRRSIPNQLFEVLDVRRFGASLYMLRGQRPRRIGLKALGGLEGL